MGAPWPLCEARLVRLRSVSSAANALNLGLGTVVPQGKVWCLIGASYSPSVAETKIVSFEKVTSASISVALLNPVSLALNPAVATFIEQGMEVFLLPDEYLIVRRDSATAGSTMTLNVQFIEIDLPLYTYDEPQVVKRQQMALSSLRQRLGGGTARGSVGPTLTGERGGRGGPLEK